MKSGDKSLKNKDLGKDPTKHFLHELATHREFVQRVARALVLDGARADDVTQLVWMAAMKHRPDPKNLRPWLRVVTKAIAYSQRRSEGRARKRETVVAQDRDNARHLLESELMDQQETRAQILARVKELEEPYLSTVLMHFFEEMTLEEIAKRQNLPSSTVRNRLRRALGQLRIRLESRYGDRGNWAIALAPLALQEERGSALDRAGKVAMAANLWWKAAAVFVGISAISLVALTSAPKDASESKQRVATSASEQPGAESGLRERVGGEEFAAQQQDASQENPPQEMPGTPASQLDNSETNSKTWYKDAGKNAALVDEGSPSTTAPATGRAATPPKGGLKDNMGGAKKKLGNRQGTVSKPQ